MNRVSTGTTGMFGAARHHATRSVVAIALSSVLGLVAVASPAQARTRLGHNGVAFGTTVSAEPVFSSGPTALVTLDCQTQPDVDRTNFLAAGNLLAAGTVGEINDEESTTSDSTTGTSSVQQVNLAAGLITGDAVTATAHTNTDGSGFDTTGDTSVSNLVINGTPVPAPVPNTVIPLQGFGRVVLNEQTISLTSDSASIIVNAIHVRVTATNPAGLPVGTNIIVGHAKAGLDQITTPILDGNAYGSKVGGAGALNSGKTALVHVPCLGSDGAVLSNSTASTTVPGALSTGTTLSTATGTVKNTTASATTTSTIQDVTVAGMVSVDEVKAQANASANRANRTFSDTGSSFTNISVSGVPTLPDPVPPNSVFAIPGVGTLYLHRIIQNDRHIEVRMIELVVTVPGAPLPVGTDIRVGVAEASVH
jgi:hypothetical protein